MSYYILKGLINGLKKTSGPTSGSLICFLPELHTGNGKGGLSQTPSVFLRLAIKNMPKALNMAAPRHKAVYGCFLISS